ncbi:fimbrial biogenesis outer membrane usher protein, partial [Escherichia coli]|nr:fimbrial biogenesis outer membrane usher protein [Escherichia coli]
SLTSNKKGETTMMAGASGTSLQDNNLSWSVMQGYNSINSDNTGSVSANYRGGIGEYQVGYNYSRNNKQVTYGAQGGVVLHPYGLSFTQPLGDTMALVKAEGAGNLKVSNNSGVYTDHNGYAVVPYLTPYRRTNLTLDSSLLSDNVDLLSDSRPVVPTNGALALADFPTTSGKKVMFTFDNVNIPFGSSASVQNKNSISTGIVDEQQRVWLTGVPEKGNVHVKWSGGQCNAQYELKADDSSISKKTINCQ